MKDNPFTSRFESLPSTLPIFPLGHAVLLPGQRLPLNIFEPRYLSMVLDALGEGRHIGMVQPRDGTGEANPVPVYDVGCAGRITAFQETDDARLLVQLHGVCRFEIAAEVEPVKAYRRVHPDWSRFIADLAPQPELHSGLAALQPALRRFAEANKLDVSWDSLEALAAGELIDFLSIRLPFDTGEKQALMEAPSVVERAELLRVALEMATSAHNSPSARRH